MMSTVEPPGYSEPSDEVARHGRVSGRLERPNYRAVLNAALAAFARSGFYGASMREIAKTARTSLSNVYNYFPSKAQLLVAVLGDANDTMREVVQDSIHAGGASASDRAVSAVHGYIRFVLGEPQAAQVAVSEIRYLTGEERQRITAARDESQAVLERIIADGMATGEFSIENAKDAARAILTMCMAVSGWYRPGGPLDAEAVVQLYGDYALRLLGARWYSGPTVTRAEDR